MEVYQQPTVTTLLDPNALQPESGLSAAALLTIAEANGWQVRQIAGRTWIADADYRRWLEAGRPG